MERLYVLLGLLVIGLLVTDVFVTVFDPEGHGGPVTRRQNSAVWWLWKKVAPEGRRGDSWLALGGPFLAVLTPAVWAALLLVGFALIYYPWIEGFLVSPGSLRTPWAEALYFSGFTAATLGTGDLVPDQVPLRIASILQTLSGFALLSAALSYILAIYRENGRKATLASDLALHWAGDPDARDANAVSRERERWLEEVARELVHVIQAHAQYPILHYFRPEDRSNALALQIAPLVRLTSTAESPRHDRSRPAEHPTPGAVLVARAIERYLVAADRRFVRSADSEQDRPPADRYERLLSYMAY